ncbi:hypothetical protein M9H77_13855 [Catharanthus roseus]|uniref:Uncharacterized protein n=1 Tax=Catharanthus roseus TaxID=4058 RepID=A0ACC0BLI2_CATRO|nr:hypothetical protein M9H77_13855 [Catharanthus roseus]
MDNTPSRLGNIPRTYSTRSEHYFISPLIEEKDYVPYRVSTSQVSERDEDNHHVQKVFKTKENIVKGHYANKCKMKKKINNLNISEELKDSLEKLFLESDDSEDRTSAS